MKRTKPLEPQVTVAAPIPKILLAKMREEVRAKGIRQSQIIRWALCERYGLPLGIR